MTRRRPPPDLELWGGPECTVQRVGERYGDQSRRSGHHDRIGDLDLFASLGLKAIRYPVLWDRGLETPLGQAEVTIDDRTVSLHQPGEKADTSFLREMFLGASFLRSRRSWH